MNKRGISPLIATVFLVGFVMILAVVVFAFSTNQTYKAQDNVEQLYSQPLFVKFEASFSFENCDNIGIQCGDKIKGNNCYTMLIENQEGKDIDYLIWTEGNRGADFCGPIQLESYNSNLVNVYFDPNKVGLLSNSISARVVPVKP